VNTLKFEDRALDVKTKTIRKEGYVPGVLYGNGMETENIKMKSLELSQMLAMQGEIYKVKTKAGSNFVKFGGIQLDPVSHDKVHFSLVALKKGEKTSLEIPVTLIGEAKGVKEGGKILTIRDAVMVLATPSDMPDSFQVDISHLGIGDNLTIGDIKLPKGIELQEDADKPVVICSAPAAVVEEEVADLTENSPAEIEAVAEKTEEK
jgi:large subunit ribosomal protein L25